MSVNFWKNKRVFITGHTGFKGGWLSLWLQQLGADVCGYSLDVSTDNNLFTIANVGKDMQSVIGDIRDYDSLYKSISLFKPQIVIHLAAQALVRDSYQNPIETYSTNVMGTVHLLECARKIDDVHVVVNVTSDKCYANNEWHWGYRESDALGGYDPYSNSKGCSELLTSAYRASYFKQNTTDNKSCAIATARAGNVIGGGDWAKDRLIPDILNASINKKTLVIRNPKSIRPWQHVLEPLSGYLILAEKLYKDRTAYSGAWNFGPNFQDVKSVEWIVNWLHSNYDLDSWAIDESEQPHEATYLKLDCSKAQSELDWKPKWNLEQALSSIVNWHKAWLCGSDMKTICIKEIQNYTAQRGNNGVS